MFGAWRPSVSVTTGIIITVIILLTLPYTFRMIVKNLAFGMAGQMLQSYPLCVLSGFSIHRLEILAAIIYDFSTGLGKS